MCRILVEELSEIEKRAMAILQELQDMAGLSRALVEKTEGGHECSDEVDGDDRDESFSQMSVDKLKLKVLARAGHKHKKKRRRKKC